MTAISTIADYLVELTNTAFENSQVAARLQIAGLSPVNLEPPVLVASVLDSMESSSVSIP